MRRGLRIAGVIVGFLAGAVVGLFSIDAQSWIRGPLHASSRYSGFGGAVQGLIEGVIAMCSGALVFGRGAWLAGGVINRVTGGKPTFGDRLMSGDLIVLGVGLLWAYLIWVSW